MRIHVFPERLELVPGEPASLQVDIYNEEDVIDGYVVTLVGLAAEVLSQQPAELSLFPKTEGSVTIVFSPSAHLAAGARTAGVRVDSTTDASRSDTVQIPIKVAERVALSLDVEPQTVTAGRRTHFGLIVENRGNAKASVSLAGKDPEGALEFRIGPPRLDVPPGGRQVARAVVSGKRPFMGTPVARVITFSGHGDAGDQQTMATFIQRPLLSRGVLTFFALLVALAVWALALFAGFSRLLQHQQVKTTNASSSSAGAGTGASGSGAGAGSGAAPGGAAGAGAGGAGAGAGAGAGGAGGAGGATGQLTGIVLGPSVTQALVMSSPAAVDQAASAGVTQAVVAAYLPSNPSQSVGAAVTDASGAFTITGLKPGSYLLKAGATGYQTLWYPSGPTPAQAVAVTVAAGGGAQAPLVFSLAGLPGSVSGIVQSVTGPVMGATISVAGSNQAGVMTTSNGAFQLAGLATPATLQLVITKTGFPTATVSVTLNAGEHLTGQQYLLSTQAGTVSGTVTDNQGVPIGGARVVVANAAGAQLGATTTMTAGTVGSFMIANLPTPATDTVVVSAPGYVSVTNQISLDAATASLNLAPQLTPVPITISGTVTRAATPGGPCPPCALSAVSVALSGKNFSTTVVTGSDGAYAIPNLLPGQYNMSFTATGYTPVSMVVTLAPGQNKTENPTLTAAPSTVNGNDDCFYLVGSTTVSLTTSSGAKVAGVATVTLPQQYTGGYAVTGVPAPGMYVLHFRFPGGASTTEAVAVTPGAASNAGPMPCPTLGGG